MQNVIDALKKKIKRRDQKINQLNAAIIMAGRGWDAAKQRERQLQFEVDGLTGELDDLKREWIARTKHDGRIITGLCIITGFAVGVAAWVVLWS